MTEKHALAWTRTSRIIKAPPEKLYEAVVTFEEVSGGTEVTFLCRNLPPGLRAEDNEAGSRLSLEQLARRFE
jgi:uncharacterized protein YndB with AHSA1/START domain